MVRTIDERDIRNVSRFGNGEARTRHREETGHTVTWWAMDTCHRIRPNPKRPKNPCEKVKKRSIFLPPKPLINKEPPNNAEVPRLNSPQSMYGRGPVMKQRATIISKPVMASVGCTKPRTRGKSLRKNSKPKRAKPNRAPSVRNTLPTVNSPLSNRHLIVIRKILHCGKHQLLEPCHESTFISWAKRIASAISFIDFRIFMLFFWSNR